MKGLDARAMHKALSARFKALSPAEKDQWKGRYDEKHREARDKVSGTAKAPKRGESFHATGPVLPGKGYEIEGIGPELR